MDNHKIIPIYSANTEVDATMVQNLLTNQGIKSFLKNATIGTTAAYLVTAGGAGAIKVMINKDDYTKAKKILKDNDLTAIDNLK